MTKVEKQWFDGGFQMGLRMSELVALRVDNLPTYLLAVYNLDELQESLHKLDALIKEVYHASNKS